MSTLRSTRSNLRLNDSVSRSNSTIERREKISVTPVSGNNSEFFAEFDSFRNNIRKKFDERPRITSSLLKQDDKRASPLSSKDSSRDLIFNRSEQASLIHSDLLNAVRGVSSKKERKSPAKQKISNINSGLREAYLRNKLSEPSGLRLSPKAKTPFENLLKNSTTLRNSVNSSKENLRSTAITTPFAEKNKQDSPLRSLKNSLQYAGENKLYSYASITSKTPKVGNQTREHLSKIFDSSTSKAGRLHVGNPLSDFSQELDRIRNQSRKEFTPTRVEKIFGHNLGRVATPTGTDRSFSKGYDRTPKSLLEENIGLSQGTKNKTLAERVTLSKIYELQDAISDINNQEFDNLPARKGGENIDDSNTVQGLRDVLLVKCKQAIEELHLELEEERKKNLKLESTIGKLELESSDKETKIRDFQHQIVKLQDDKSDLQTQVYQLRNKAEDLENELEYSHSEFKVHRDFEENFQAVCNANNQMKEKIEELSNEIRKRDKVVKEWNETLTSIDSKIATLEEDKQALLQENKELYAKIENLQHAVQENEALNRLLQGKCEYSDRLTSQLEKENKLLDELKSENQNLHQTIDRLNNKIQEIGEDMNDQILKKESTFRSEKLEIERTLREKYHDEIEEYKKAYKTEIIKLQNDLENLQVKLGQVGQERNYLKEDLKILQEKIRDKEREIKIINENYSTRIENLQRNKSEEIEKLQGIIDDQSSLIASYEKILEKEKLESQEKINSLLEQNSSYKDEIFNLSTKNNYLNTKLQECQEELINIQSEIKNTFSAEEEKRMNLMGNLSNLEKENDAREEIALRQKDEIHQLKSAIRKSKKTIESLEHDRIKLNEDLIKTQIENKELRLQQKDFGSVLQSKLDEITNDLKAERERRVEAEHQCTELKEQIMTLEGTIRTNAAAIRLELLKKEEELEQLKYEKRMESAAERKKVAQNLSNRMDLLEKATRSPNRDKFYQDYSFNKIPKEEAIFEVSHDQDSYLKTGESRKYEAKRQPGTLQQNYQDIHATRTTNQSDVISRFKSVINKLEAKVEKIAHEMNS